MNDVREQVYLRALTELRDCRSGQERRRVVRRAARTLGQSEQTVYRGLKRRGWDSGRAPRADRGRSAVGEDELRAVARIMAKGRNKRGEANVPTKEAVEIAQAQGLIPDAISASQVGRRLRQAGLSMGHMRAPSPAISRVSQHPNHVWVVDISVAIQWYFHDEQGRALRFYSDAGARFYEGKRQNLADQRRVILRYLVVDHYSGAFYVRYYYAAGENSLDVVDFLHRAMAGKDNRLSYPFRGVPRRLVADQGPGFKAALTRNLLDALDVEVELHLPGNAKASGAVETRHNHWQRTFEGRLAVASVNDLDQLNSLAERFCALHNAERALTRSGRPPMATWTTIRPDQLVEAPDRDVFLQLAATNRRTGVLNNKLQLRADGRTWEIAGSNVHPRQRLAYRLSPFTEAGIRVWDEHERELAATEIHFDPVSGFPQNGRRHVWDDDDAQGSSHKPVPAQTLAADVASDSDAVRLDQVFDDLDERLAKHAFLAAQQEGQVWQPSGGDGLADEPLLGSVEARERVAAMLGRPLGHDEAAWWRERIGDGCTQGAVDAAMHEFLHGVAVPTAEQLG